MNSPLSTALAPVSVVIVITTFPLTCQLSVDTRMERRHRLGIQHGPRGRIADLDLLTPRRAVPVEEVEFQVVGLAVAQVHVHRETGG